MVDRLHLPAGGAFDQPLGMFEPQQKGAVQQQGACRHGEAL
jgi:hypothetical protein